MNSKTTCGAGQLPIERHKRNELVNDVRKQAEDEERKLTHKQCVRNLLDSARTLEKKDAQNIHVRSPTPWTSSGSINEAIGLSMSYDTKKQCRS